MRNILLDVPLNPKVLLAVMAIISVATLSACTMPGLQATKIDAMVSFRNE
jgi:hypothetical protein